MILDAVPKETIAGDSWRWTVSLSEYPAPTWTVTYYFKNADGAFDAAAAADGTSHAISVSAATTADLRPGRYKWFARASDGTIAETIGEGWIEVLPNPAASGARDLRSNSRKMLDAVEATLQGRASNDQLAMSINGRSISRIPLPELRDWRTQLKSEVKAQEGGANGGKSRNLKVRYVRP